MILLHAAPIRWGAIGGPYVSVPNLVAAQNACDDVEAALLVTVPGQPRVSNPQFSIFDGKTSLASSGAIDLPAPFNRPHLVVFHSTYVPMHAAIAAKLRKRGIPYILCPRGGMTQFAQAAKGWKKKLGNLLFFNKLVAHAAALHCLTRGEAAASSGWNRPMFTVGNGVHLPPEPDPASPEPAHGLRIVFLGRLRVDHKGLDMLLDACALVRAELRRADARVELHGPDYRGTAKFLAGRIARLGLQDLVTVHGPVVGDAKTALLRRADVFLHPSRWEGHPLAVLEALAHGVPCLLTPNTNMAQEVAAAGAGWQVGKSAVGVAAGLKRLLQTDGETLKQAGNNARRLAVERYSWDRVADHSLEEYRKWAA